MSNYLSKKISDSASKFMNVSKDITEATLDYLKYQNQNTFNKLEISLKATGYTVKTYFDKLGDNTADVECIKIFKQNASILAEIDLIRNSSELSDNEKLQRLDKVYEKEKELIKMAEEQIHRSNVEFRKHVATIATCVGGVIVISTKKVGPVLAKLPGKVIKHLPK